MHTQDQLPCDHWNIVHNENVSFPFTCCICLGNVCANILNSWQTASSPFEYGQFTYILVHTALPATMAASAGVGMDLD